MMFLEQAPEQAVKRAPGCLSLTADCFAGAKVGYKCSVNQILK
uniref:Uncharacterized protein n=1 Tax=Anguilla anguilla TaxID=7936 RepID=A0A0E9QP63_ANGAN